MATISNGSVTVTIQPGEQYRVIASGEAYVDIGGGSTQSYRLINGSSERLLGGFIVATPVTVRVVSGSVEYRIEPYIAGNAGVGNGNIYDENGNEIVLTAGSNPYQPTFASFFGGSNQNLVASGVLSSLTNISQGAARFVFRNGSIGTATFRNVVGSSAGRFTIGLDSSNKMRVNLSDGTNTFVYRSVDTYPVVSNPSADFDEKDFLFWWDTAFAAGSRIGKMYLNGVELTTEIVTDTGASFVNQYNNQTLSIGGTNLGANPIAGDLAEVMLWLSTVSINGQDFTSTALRNRLYKNGSIADVGLNGAYVTGEKPDLYFSMRDGDLPTAFVTNRGRNTNATWSWLLTGGVDGNIPLIAYGDSLVEGTGATLSSDRWFNILSTNLSPKRKRINQGVGGETGVLIKRRFMREITPLTEQYPDSIYFIEGGYNNVANGSADMVLHIAEMVAALLNRLPNAKYIVLGTPNGSTAGESSGGARYLTIVDANNQLSALYGNKFIDIRGLMIARGLSVNSITPTTQDNTDIANDVVPTSLRADNIHYNNAGHLAYELFVRERIIELDY